MAACFVEGVSTLSAILKLKTLASETDFLRMATTTQDSPTKQTPVILTEFPTDGETAFAKGDLRYL